jgi:hypothetical protein
MEKIRALLIIILSFWIMTVIEAGAANRIALVIGNSNYKSAPLKNPVNDAKDMAAILKYFGFEVTLKLDIDHRIMEKSIRNFGKKLLNGGIGLFYYAGHGTQVKGHNYLIPINSEIESEADVKFETVDAGLILGKMEDAQNDLNIIILDACRNNPFARSFRSPSLGLARMDAPKGSLIAYSTAPGSVAADGDNRNGIYTKYLLENMKRPGLKIEEILKNVRVAVVSETSSKQIPWESSSLMGDFYFNISKQMVSSVPISNDLNNELKEERERLEQERKELEKLKSEIVKRRNMEKERKQIETEKQKLLKEKSTLLASIPTKYEDPNIIAKDLQYVKYKNGIVYDKNTGFEWFAGPDYEMGWYRASAWVKGLDVGNGGWRLPTRMELKSLYKKGLGDRNLTSLLDTPGIWFWSRNAKSKGVYWYYNFKMGNEYYYRTSIAHSNSWILAVRKME